MVKSVEQEIYSVELNQNKQLTSYWAQRLKAKLPRVYLMPVFMQTFISNANRKKNHNLQNATLKYKL